MSIKIGVMGNIGSFSEEAALHYCHKNNIKDYKLAYLITAERVLSSLVENKIDKAIFPIENSNGGIVYEAVYAMAKYNFNIEKMFDIDVRHCLQVSPGKKFEEIKKIASHQQAIKQCKMFIKNKFPQAEIIEWSDTAEAAKDLSQGKLSEDTAIIASSQAATIYGLEILEEGIQDLKFNFTTFIAATK